MLRPGWGAHMPTALQTTFTVVNATPLALLYVAVFIVWPGAEAVVRRRWGWAVAIVLGSPVAGLLWLLSRRRYVRRRATA